MEFPDDLRYTADHEWLRTMDDETTQVGVTDYAQDALGDVVYVGLPEVGRSVRAGEPIAEVESTKSVSDVFSPLSGDVVAVNEALREAPELINRDPYGEGWIVTIRPTGSTDETAGLMDAASYRDLVHKA
ncbi:glycine cleavage system H protein [Acidimicrobium ferrooxidans DSM 10331]|uniref:Glycine cleavage system H protein n=1 Tax=Acidimicrobium ferrooxidans (strain DSM 10331 / JCM 15462 / NBRC 103882 / ICP) TaxID=525909 RepID=C7LZ99_ACIFD|nr:glycine cleavage system protein GcvH [Acidimicrobium ferrooxidans]ACU54057.1 glycine cleavage system H protein [Acidimicrobium ferrooxidans DSM 10331]